MNSGTNCLNMEGTLSAVLPREHTKKGFEYLPIVIDVIGSRWSQFLTVRVQNGEKYDLIEETEIGSKITVQVEIIGWEWKTPNDGVKRGLYLNGTDLHWGWLSELTK